MTTRARGSGESFVPLPCRLSGGQVIGNEPRFGPAPVGNTGAEPGNRPLVLVSVLGIIVVGVLWIGILGKVFTGGSRVVQGVPLAVGEQTEQTEPATPADISRNPLLSPGREVTAAQCSLPALGTTAPELEAFYREGLVCLDKAWTPVLRAVGKPMVSPKLSIADIPKAKCGVSPTEEEALAFYCNRDRTIYMPRDRLMRAAGDSAPYHLAVLGHEYGHHVQALTGILSAAATQEDTEDEEAALTVSRRTELQANCLSGLFLDAARRGGALESDFVDEAVDSFGDTLSSDTHGSRRNQLEWAERGAKGGTTASCDTWSASTTDVE
ncbi:neutral zinc metallopeptidase [Actinokineospora globicatena]|nr:neutral zinc metallopeptidase [Actinokineospora globicatena]